MSYRSKRLRPTSLDTDYSIDESNLERVSLDKTLSKAPALDAAGVAGEVQQVCCNTRAWGTEYSTSATR